MQIETWQIHVAWLQACIQSGKDYAQPFYMVWPNTFGDSFLVESLQSFVAKSLNHFLSVTRGVSGVKHKNALPLNTQKSKIKRAPGKFPNARFVLCLLFFG